MTRETSEECYAFASFRLYPKQRTLLRGGDIVAIGGRAFDLLHILVSRAGTVVSPNTIMDFVWPNIAVEEASLRVQMAIVRKVLSQCDEAQGAIETIALRGYCFILSVHHRPNDVERTELEEPLTNLPVLLNPVIGREDTIKLIGAALDERQLITITGPAGIGKTTVAIASANHYIERFHGLVTFVDLSHVSDGEGAAAAIIEALGLAREGDTLVALCEHLRSRHLLLILDTCEHIVEPIANLCEVLLSNCTKLTLLVTSREALRATGERTHRLASLTFPEEDEEVDEENMTCFSAITLLVDRVRSSTDFEVRIRDLPVIAEICRRLDGIPLALELAAARVMDLGLREIAAHLDDRFTILTRGRRTALPRHRTLSAALDWSFSLLSDDEQTLLRHLATLGRSFTVERALAGGGTCQRPPEALSGLYEKSILSVDMRSGVPIYRLFDTTRAYVAGIGVN